MLWISLAATVIAGIVVAAVVSARRRHHDLGSVSRHWVVQHDR